MIPWLFVLGGLILLIAGGEALVRGSATAAQRLRISPLIVGLVLVGFGTSMPELATSVRAVLAGAPDIAVGNVVGSNIANVLLILAIGALIYPLPASRQAILRDGLVALAAAAIVLLLAQRGSIGRPEGLIFLLVLAAYVAGTYLSERRSNSASAEMHRGESGFAHTVRGPIWIPVLIALMGIAGVVAGATLLVDGASAIARAAGVSERVIGLTLVAVGTSAPELAVTIIASIRREASIAFGNILGSNIFNVFGILGVSAIVQPLPINLQTANFDVWLMAATSLLILVFAYTKLRLERWEAGICLVFYAVYMWILFNPTVIG